MIPQDTDFSIVIPKIGANSNIISNVNSANEAEYLSALTKGVAHTLGTTFPGEGGHIFCLLIPQTNFGTLGHIMRFSTFFLS